MSDIKSPYRRWSNTAIDCEDTGQDCDNCYAWSTFAMRAGEGCHIPDAIQQLKERGVAKPVRHPRLPYRRGQTE